MKLIRTFVASAYLALIAITGIGVSTAHANADRSEPHLAAVRFVSPDPLILAEIVEAAKSAGWDRSKIDKPGTVTILVPDNYTPDQFKRLLDAVGKVKSRNFGLQMIDNLGRAIGPDGMPVED